ncbi:MAG: hypothetical protein Q8L73_07130 [Methylotenera sp.]|nr:hypothetical protein [Methylotenera sp.]
MLAMHSNFSLAENMLQDASSTEQTTLQVLELAPDQESTNITWPLLSGESVQSLAALFYPKNKKMQRLFIRKTLQLSGEIRPNLNAYTTTNQASLIIIPDIKSLAKHNGKIKSAPSKKASASKQPKLHMSYGLKDAEKFALSPEMQADYEALVKKNEKLKQDLDKLNAKLAHLQQVMVALDVEVKRVQSLPEPDTISKLVPDGPVLMPAPATEAVANNLKNPEEVKVKDDAVKIIATPPPVVNPSASIPAVAKSPVSTSPTVSTERVSFFSRYLLEIAASVLVLGLVFAMFLYRRRQARKFSYFTADSLQPMDKKEFISATPSVDEADNSQTPSELSAGIMDNDLDAIMSMKNKAEGDMVLEQAKIYVNINREREAIMLLKSQIQLAPKTSLHHWLALLDIYRQTNQKEEFLNYAKQLHQTFNVMLPTWDNAPLPMVVATSLEEFPHVIEHIIELWTYCDMDEEKMAETKAYLDTLLTDNRDSERAGFGLEVLQEIMLLRDLLDVREKLTHEE